jgi:hypothetical protein
MEYPSRTGSSARAGFLPSTTVLPGLGVDDKTDVQVDLNQLGVTTVSGHGSWRSSLRCSAWMGDIRGRDVRILPLWCVVSGAGSRFCAPATEQLDPGRPGATGRDAAAAGASIDDDVAGSPDTDVHLSAEREEVALGVGDMPGEAARLKRFAPAPPAMTYPPVTRRALTTGAPVVRSSGVT